MSLTKSEYSTPKVKVREKGQVGDDSYLSTYLHDPSTGIVQVAPLEPRLWHCVEVSCPFKLPNLPHRRVALKGKGRRTGASVSGLALTTHRWAGGLNVRHQRTMLGDKCRDEIVTCNTCCEIFREMKKCDGVNELVRSFVPWP